MKTRSRMTRYALIESLEVRNLFALDPSAFEQEMLELTNRFRTDPANEYARLIKSDAPLQSHDAEVTPQLTFSNVDANMLRSELSQLAPSPPLAWNEIMQDMATAQNDTMISKNSQEHFPGLSNALFNRGVPIEAGTAQNAFYNNLGVGKTPFFVHSAYVIDWAAGAPGATGGMQPGRGHRVNMLNPNYNQTASAIKQTTSLVSTQFFAKVSSAQKMAVGSVFEDKNKSGFYDAREGIGGVQILFDGPSGRFTTTSMTAGGYQIVLPAGTYSVTATGGSMRTAITLPSLTIGATNVWQRLIYDPNAIAPDAREPNNSTAAATDLGNSDQTLNSLTLHAGDTDFFKIVPRGTGLATFEVGFVQANGNLDVRLLDAAGTVLATSATSNAPEQLSASVTRGQTYFVQVYSSNGATNGLYSLRLDLPEPSAPTAIADRATMALSSQEVVLPILNNDLDPDGSTATLVPTLQSAGLGTYRITTSKTLLYRPNQNYTGIDRATYNVTDDQGLTSANARVEIFVVDFARSTPWTNPRQVTDINDDGVTSPLDALLIINELSARGARPLPNSLSGAQSPLGFVDVNGNNQIQPLDALLVINALHRIRGGNGQAEGESNLATDAAIQHMFAEDEAMQQRRKRK